MGSIWTHFLKHNPSFSFGSECEADVRSRCAAVRLQRLPSLATCCCSATIVAYAGASAPLMRRLPSVAMGRLQRRMPVHGCQNVIIASLLQKSYVLHRWERIDRRVPGGSQC